MNKVILIGNLTRDPELLTTQSGVHVCKFTLAVNRNHEDASGEKFVDFINCVAWRGLAETCHKYLAKGKKCCVCGELNIRSYEVDGDKKYITEIKANEVEFLSPKSTDNDEKEVELTPVEDTDLPF